MFNFKKVSKKTSEPVRRVTKQCQECGKSRRMESNRNKCAGCRAFEVRIYRGEILKPDTPNVTVEPYKEPLDKVDDGYGYYGAVVSTDNGSHIQCHICGHFFVNLSSHIPRHDMKLNEYRENFGLRKSVGLVSEVERKRLQDAYNGSAFAKQHKAATKKAHKKVRKMVEDGEWGQGGDAWSPQLRNERGRCRKQMIASIQALYEKNLTTPTYQEFIAEYGNGAFHTLKTFFGDFSGALKAAGFKTVEERREEHRDKMMADILNATVEFYEKYGRTPLWSDYKDSDELPHPKRVQYYFGSLVRLREAAGIPQYIVRGDKRMMEVK